MTLTDEETTEGLQILTDALAHVDEATRPAG